MLAALGLMGLTNIHQMNGLKNLLALCINGIAIFAFLAMDQIVNHSAKLRAMFGGQFTVPIVIRAVSGGGRRCLRSGGDGAQGPRARKRARSRSP